MTKINRFFTGTAAWNVGIGYGNDYWSPTSDLLLSRCVR